MLEWRQDSDGDFHANGDWHNYSVEERPAGGWNARCYYFRGGAGFVICRGELEDCKDACDGFESISKGGA